MFYSRNGSPVRGSFVASFIFIPVCLEKHLEKIYKKHIDKSLLFKILWRDSATGDRIGDEKRAFFHSMAEAAKKHLANEP
jgi:hypothetical protein